MLANRLIQQSTRRLALQPGSSLLSRTPSSIIASQVNGSQRRLIETAKISHETEQSSILARQRLNRPVSPHLSIYKPQVTWTLSILNRITGSVLSGAFYVYGALYLVAPAFGWQVGTAVMAAGIAKWGILAKGLVKFPLAFFFTYHSWNGIRHLVWDNARGINNAAVVKTGWAVLGVSVVTALGLCAM
ncbi:succinate dehydrogenase, cytochrome b556 subunit [Sphaceloma murrayae]|uniref:Succinate dehydrogenase, cytochrome b556 subunit n=1 Tax=Sphaceloma murrayae TaxID=2082308 RepID=A0A2K1QNS1_9PEZI|nr:succinate dehydrogenase, cytochrome b556 subunit [Sphaceloma murrayae]